MRAGKVTQTGVGMSAPLPVDFVQVPTDISLWTSITGTVTYTIQYTYDDIFGTNLNDVPTFNPATAQWFNSTDTNFIAATAAADSVFTKPVTAFRINQTAGTGSTTLNARQGLGQ